MHYDVFNGDADGLCALQQLRLAQPRDDAVLVTGPKRDIALLQRVPAKAGVHVTVLDVSLDRNRQALEALLAAGARVRYFDHHHAGPPLEHPGLERHIDTAPGTCTSLLVHRHVAGRHLRWAVAGAFGDNLPEAAEALCDAARMEPGQRQALRALGEALNYNAYGDSEADLLVAPAALARLLRPYDDPLAFLAGEPLARQLVQRQQEDQALADAVPAVVVTPGFRLVVLPDTGWARRILGIHANVLATRDPSRAQAVLRECDGGYVASIRAPRHRPAGADALCRGFSTGGGRAAAAGIDHLPGDQLPAFLRALAKAWPQGC